MISITCSQCHKTLLVPDDLLGKRGQCPKCGNVLDIRLPTDTPTVERTPPPSSTPPPTLPTPSPVTADTAEREMPPADEQTAISPPPVAPAPLPPPRRVAVGTSIGTANETESQPAQPGSGVHPPTEPASIPPQMQPAVTARFQGNRRLVGIGAGSVSLLLLIIVVVALVVHGSTPVTSTPSDQTTAATAATTATTATGTPTNPQPIDASASSELSPTPANPPALEPPPQAEEPLPAPRQRTPPSPNHLPAPAHVGRATVIVRNPTNAHCTSGFLIASEGYLLTKHSTLAITPLTNNFEVVINASQPDQEILKADLMFSDPTTDLALLKLVLPVPHPPLEWLQLGPDAPTHETVQVLATGFPFLRQMSNPEAPDPRAALPAVTVATGRIAGIFRSADKCNGYLYSCGVSEGTYGGALTDTEGVVLGMIFSQSPYNQWGRSLPVADLRRFLQRPCVELQLPALSTDNPPGQKLSFTAHADALAAPDCRFELNLVIDDGGEQLRVPMTLAGTVWRAEVPAARLQPVAPLKVAVVYPDSRVEGITASRQFQLNGASVALSTVAEIQFGPPLRITFADRSQRTGIITGLDSLPLDMLGLQAEIKTAGATSLTVTPLPVPLCRCTLEVRQDGKVVMTLGSTLTAMAQRLSGSGSRNLAASTASTSATAGNSVDFNAGISPPLMNQDILKVALPASFDQAVLGANGRYIIFFLPSLKSVAIFDLNQAKVIKLLPVNDNKVLLAATRSNLFVAMPNRQILKCFNLQDYNQVFSVALPFPVPVTAALAGNGGDGPLVLGLGNNKNSWLVLDEHTGRVLGRFPDAEKPIANLSSSSGGDYSISGNGRYLFYSPGDVNNPSNYFVVDLFSMETQHVANKCQTGYKSYSQIIPTFDGSWYGGGGNACFGVNGTQRKPVLNHPGSVLIPSIDGNYCLTVWTDDLLSSELKPNAIFHTAVYIANTDQPLVEFTDVNMRMLYGRYIRYGSTDPLSPIFSRVHFVPAAHLLVTLPLAGNEVILRRIDIGRLLEATPQPYLFLVSNPPSRAIRGQTFRYAMKARAKNGPITYNVDSGPPGMFVTPDGQIEWRVPDNFSAKDVAPILSVHDATGTAVYQTFKLMVSDAAVTP